MRIQRQLLYLTDCGAAIVCMVGYFRNVKKDGLPRAEEVEKTCSQESCTEPDLFSITAAVELKSDFTGRHLISTNKTGPWLHHSQVMRDWPNQCHYHYGSHDPRRAGGAENQDLSPGLRLTVDGFGANAGYRCGPPATKARTRVSKSEVTRL